MKNSLILIIFLTLGLTGCNSYSNDSAISLARVSAIYGYNSALAGKTEEEMLLKFDSMVAKAKTK